MEFRWEYAKPLLAKLERPEYGSWDRWMSWYENAWAVMTQEGFTDVKTMLDDTLVRLRLLALCWLSHDFCGAIYPQWRCTCPCWSKWVDSLEIDALRAAVTITDQKMLENLTVESGMELMGVHYEEEGVAAVYDPYNEVFLDINSRLVPLAVMHAAFGQREKLLSILSKGFGGNAELFGSMYANYCSIAEEIDEQKDLLEEELEILEQCYVRTTSADRKNDLQQQINAARELLAEKPQTDDAIEELRLRAMNDPFIFGDEASPERMNGCQWYNKLFPVVVRGEPEFHAPNK